MKLSLVLPCFNEEHNAEAAIDDVLAWFASAGHDGEVIAVDDGSRDATAEVLVRVAGREPRLRIVTHEENRGYGSAVRSGCDEASLEWIAFMDSDGQFRAADFERLASHTGEYAAVVGRRAHRADPYLRRLNADLYSLLVWATLGVRVRDVNCAMKLFRRDLWPSIRPRHATGALFNAELFQRMKLHGIDWKQVSVPHYPRVHGQPTGNRPTVILRTVRDLLALTRARDDG